MFTTVCDFNSKLFRIEIIESINIAQNLITNFYLVPFQKIVLPYTAVDCNLVFPAFILRLPSLKCIGLCLTAWFKVLVSTPYSVAKSLSSITCCPLNTFIRDSILSTTTNWSRFVTSSPFSVFSIMSVIFIFIFKITNCDHKRIVVILRTKVVLLAFKPLLHNPFL